MTPVPRPRPRAGAEPDGALRGSGRAKSWQSETGRGTAAAAHPAGDGLEAASYKAGVKPAPGLSAQHRTPEFQAAARRLATYGRDKCGIGPSSEPSG